MSQQSINVEALQYDRTLVLAIELSSKSWVLAAQAPGLQKTKAKRTIEPDMRSTDRGPALSRQAIRLTAWLRPTKQDGLVSGSPDG